MTTFNIEVTDTYNGESNYAWVRRYTIEVPEATSNYALARRAKREIGWTGKRCTTTHYGDMIEMRPYGECVVAFINVSQ